MLSHSVLSSAPQGDYILAASQMKRLREVLARGPLSQERAEPASEYDPRGHSSLCFQSYYCSERVGVTQGNMTPSIWKAVPPNGREEKGMQALLVCQATILKQPRCYLCVPSYQCEARLQALGAWLAD